MGEKGQSFECADTLVSMYSDTRKRSDFFLAYFAIGLATALEDCMPSSRWDPDPLKFISAIGAKRKAGGPVDEDVAVVVRRLEATSSIRSTKEVDKIAKVLGLNMATGLPRMREDYLKKLVLESRRSFSGSTFDGGLAVGAKRFGGKHWLAGVLSNPNSGQLSLTSPVAPLV